MLLYPTYFSSIAQYVAYVNADEVVFEVQDNFQKQTYRNRCVIYGANGLQTLNIPVLKANSKQATKDIRIDHSESWQKQHLKSITAAYNSSPFFEFLDYELAALYEAKKTYLLDFNFNCHEFIMTHAQLAPSTYHKTGIFEHETTLKNDYRFLADAKTKRTFNFEPYTQVFSHKYGFLENLSILDLLFSEGGNTLNYLESQEFNF